MALSMIEQALTDNKTTFGIEDFELVYQPEDIVVLKVGFTNKLWANVYSTGAVEFGTKEVIQANRFGATMGIINALAKHMEHFNETTKEPDDDSTGTSNHP